MLKADYEYIKGEDETMTIETKYNIGDEVWHRFVGNNIKTTVRMTDKELKEFMAKSAQAHTEILKHCGEELKRSVGASVVLRLHDGTTYSPGYACPVCGGEMVIEKIQMQERYMMRLCQRCGTTIKTPYSHIEVHTPF